jgi:hypothetical protein
MQPKQLPFSSDCSGCSKKMALFHEIKEATAFQGANSTVDEGS